MKYFVVLIAIFATCEAQMFFTDIESRVVGGEFAEEGQFPHQVALFRDNRFTCGGSIIAERFVLTAAHCVYGPDDRL